MEAKGDKADRLGNLIFLIGLPSFVLVREIPAGSKQNGEVDFLKISRKTKKQIERNFYHENRHRNCTIHKTPSDY